MSKGGGGTPVFGTSNVLSYFHTKSGLYPSNADIWWLFKNSDEAMDSAEFGKVNRGNSPAPNGHYIVDAFNIDRSAVSGVSGLTSETAYYNRPSCVATQAGRVFWGGVKANGFGDKIYVSPILEDIGRAGICAQQQDPTSEDNSDLLPSDGGVIVVSGMGNLIKMWALGSSLLCFASNGIWQISGSSGAGFAANDYSVRKVSDHNASGSMSFVEAEGNLFWWNVNGIYTLVPNQVTGEFQAQSLTDQTIKTFIEEIPTSNFPFVKGAYSKTDMTIQWLFRSTEAATLTESFQYDRILNLRLSQDGAFYPWTISQAVGENDAPFVSGILVTSGMGSTISEDTVVVDGDPVYVEV